MKRTLTLYIFFTLLNFFAFSQMKIGLPVGIADASAILDISNKGDNVAKGFLGPQVALTANNSASPITNPATGLMVYNTSTTGAPPNDVSPGYYYWNGSIWVLFAISKYTLPVTSNNIYGVDGTLSGNRSVGLGGYFLNFTGGNVGIGNSNPTSKLDVLGTGKFSSDVLINGITVGLGGTSAVSNTIFGANAGLANTTGTNNVFSGYQTGAGNTTGAFNIGSGSNALKANTTGSSNTAIGYNSLSANTTGYNNVSIGAGSGAANTIGIGNVFLGNMAGAAETGSNKLYIHNSNSSIPLIYGNFLTGVLGIGLNNPQSSLHSSGTISTGIPLGGLGGAAATDGAFKLFNLTNANTVSIKSGITTASYALTLPPALPLNNQLISSDALGNLSFVDKGAFSWSKTGNLGITDDNFIGTLDNVPLNFRVNNTRVGKIDATTNNTYFGYLAGNATTGVQNTAIGANSLKNNSTGTYNFSGGVNALLNNSTGANNISVGYNSLQSNTTGYSNIAVGNGAGFTNIAGFGNVFLGYQSGYNEIGNNNLYIANNASATPLMYGNFATGVLGIGFTNPQSTLHSSGTISTGIPLGGLGGAAATDGIFKLYNLTNANAVSIKGGITATSYTLTLPPALPLTNQLISSDASGNLSFVDKGAFSWSKAGNSGTTDVDNFLGTLDNVPLNFRVNNTRVGKIDATTTYNTYLGYLAGNATTGVQNTVIGANSLKNNSTGSYNFSGGVNALLNNTTGANNIAAGYNSLQANTTGYFNVALGNGAGFTNVAGFGNVFLGNQSGYNEIGDNNLYIANNASATPLIYGNFATNKLGVGFTTPQTTLHSSGTVSIGIPLGGLGGAPATNGTIQLYNATNSNTVSLKSGITTTPYTLTLPLTLPTSNQLLMGDIGGNLSWVNKGELSWSKTGNTGITDDNFIGTMDYIPFNIRVNNLKAARIDPASKNTYFGYLSGSATTGTNNTGFGASVLSGNTTGANNAAIGFNSLNANTTGYQNFAGGTNASLTNTTGYNNTVVGANSGQGIVTGYNNTIIGANVTGLLGTLSNNVIIADGLGNQRINIDATGNVGLGTITPAAALDVTSITKGALLPRMTKAQRNAITTPPVGSIVYQLDNLPGLRVWNGTNWMRYTEVTD